MNFPKSRNNENSYYHTCLLLGNITKSVKTSYLLCIWSPCQLTPSYSVTPWALTLRAWGSRLCLYDDIIVVPLTWTCAFSIPVMSLTFVTSLPWSGVKLCLILYTLKPCLSPTLYHYFYSVGNVLLILKNTQDHLYYKLILKSYSYFKSIIFSLQYWFFPSTGKSYRGNTEVTY